MIYVSDGDLPVFQRAQWVADGNLSQAISRAPRRFVDVEEGKLEGYHEITVQVGAGKHRRQRFVGVQLVEWARSSKDRTEQFTVYRSRTGKYVVHCERSPEFVHQAGPDGEAYGVAQALQLRPGLGPDPRDRHPRGVRDPRGGA